MVLEVYQITYQLILNLFEPSGLEIQGLSSGFSNILQIENILAGFSDVASLTIDISQGECLRVIYKESIFEGFQKSHNEKTNFKRVVHRVQTHF